MRIGLIADTHIPGGATEVPPQVVKAFQGVDVILHAGNIYTSPVLDWLERIAPVKAAGSADRDRSCHGDPRVAEQQVLEVEGQTIGVMHDLMVPGFGGYIFPGVLATHFHYDSSRPLIPDQVFGRAVDIAVFGHTCTALVEEYGGTLLINPGSPTWHNQTVKIGTVAVLEVTGQGRQVEIVNLAELR